MAKSSRFLDETTEKRPYFQKISNFFKNIAVFLRGPQKTGYFLPSKLTFFGERWPVAAFFGMRIAR